jgi:hypothetical protein
MPPNPRDALQRYLARYPGAGAEPASVQTGPLPMHRGRTVVLMVLGLLGVEWWVWTLIGPWFRHTVGQGRAFGVDPAAALGFLLSVLALTVIIAVAVQLHRPGHQGNPSPRLGRRGVHSLDLGDPGLRGALPRAAPGDGWRPEDQPEPDAVYQPCGGGRPDSPPCARGPTRELVSFICAPHLPSLPGLASPRRP